MKRFVTVFMVAIMLVSTLGIAVSAGGYIPTASGHSDISFVLKQADPQYVEKDGKISEGEYERVIVDLTEENSQVWVTYGNNTDLTLPAAANLLASMEYYFSWDEVHGFNIAVKCKPDVVKQVLTIKEGDKPEDDFLTQTGFQIAFDTEKVPGTYVDLYYSLAKRTDNGEYLLGHWNQLGLQGNYAPKQDEYIISYEDDGSVILEWSVPFEHITENPAVGSEIYLTVAATSTADPNSTEVDWNKMCGTSFGDCGYMVPQIKNKQLATALISDERIAPPQDDWENPFIDVKEGDWFYDAVKYVNTEALMNGITDTTFEPKTPMSRGMLVTVLWRAEGSPTPIAAAPFSDLTKNYYKDAIAWAVENNIANGTGNNKFEPELALSRETIATLLSRYAEYKGITSDKTADLATFPDGADVSGWAKTGMEWAVANGIITGKKSGDQDLLAAKMTSNRAEVATMLMRFNGAFGE